MADIADLAQPAVDRAQAVDLAAVRAALAGVGADFCEVCGVGIPDGRRVAYPSASTCLDCQEEIERSERVLGRRYA